MPAQPPFYRSQLYQEGALEEVENPSVSWRNIDFGLLMGASVMRSTTLHIWVSFKAHIEVFVLWTSRQDVSVDSPNSTQQTLSR